MEKGKGKGSRGDLGHMVRWVWAHHNLSGSSTKYHPWYFVAFAFGATDKWSTSRVTTRASLWAHMGFCSNPPFIDTLPTT